VVGGLQIVAHRGAWEHPGEQNTLPAFQQALSLGFGIETDLWWRDGKVLLSHDPPRGSGLALTDLLELHGALGSDAPLALNAKSDALFDIDRSILAPLDGKAYFFFDMSVPDMLGFRHAALPFFSRQSELERDPVLYRDAQGVWLDQFFGDWVDDSTLLQHAKAGKAMCIVSPELHGRPYEAAWTRYRDALASPAERPTSIMLCTDHPLHAQEFFAP
jgi:glycerophosphoryl diester phosphodiesterase